jgi:hypothetical protein
LHVSLLCSSHCICLDRAGVGDVACHVLLRQIAAYPHAASSRSGYTSRVNSAPLTGPPLCCRAQVMSVGRRGVGPLHRRPLADVSVGCDPCPHTGLALVCGGGVDSSGPPRGREREELGDQGSPAQSAGGPGPCAGAQRPSPPHAPCRKSGNHTGDKNLARFSISICTARHMMPSPISYRPQRP